MGAGPGAPPVLRRRVRHRLLRGRGAWLSIAAPPAGDDALLPDVIVCVSAGFFAFHLWALVHHRRVSRKRQSTLVQSCTVAPRGPY